MRLRKFTNPHGQIRSPVSVLGSSQNTLRDLGFSMVVQCSGLTDEALRHVLDIMRTPDMMLVAVDMDISVRRV